MNIKRVKVDKNPVPYRSYPRVMERNIGGDILVVMFTNNKIGETGVVLVREGGSYFEGRKVGTSYSDFEIGDFKDSTDNFLIGNAQAQN